jgi:hypothetical protein
LNELGGEAVETAEEGWDRQPGTPLSQGPLSREALSLDCFDPVGASPDPPAQSSAARSSAVQKLSSSGPPSREHPSPAFPSGVGAHQDNPNQPGA